jgi:hypothetical protein
MRHPIFSTLFILQLLAKEYSMKTASTGRLRLQKKAIQRSYRAASIIGFNIKDQKLAAELILDDVDKHGGDSSLAARWARLWLSRSQHGYLHTDVQKAKKGQMEMFDAR